MFQYQSIAVKLHRTLCVCLCATLLYSFFGAVSDAWAQEDPLSKAQICQALDMSSEDCTRITSVISEPGNTTWVLSTTATVDANSLQSGNIDDDQQSCLIFDVSFASPTVVQFLRRVDSQPADELYFSVDDVRQEYSLRPAPTAVLREWSREVHFVQPGDTTLSWCYTKDGSDPGGEDNGEDSAWIDDLSFTPTADASLNRELVCLVLDMSSEDCAQIAGVTFSPPEFQWIITTKTFALGGSSLRRNANAPVNNATQIQSTCIIFELAPGELPANTEIRASGRISSPRLLDQLQFIADNNLRLDTIFASTGNVQRDWRQKNYFLQESITELRWCYVRDFRDSNPTASAWIDRLSFSISDITYERRICAALDFEDSCSMIQSITYNPPELLWIITSETSVFGGSSLRSANPVIDRTQNQSTCIILELELPANTEILASARINATGGFDQLRFNAGNLRLDTISATRFQIERPWRPESYFLSTATSTLRWCYNKGTASGAPNTAWIDRLSVSASDIPYESRVCTALNLLDSDCPIQSISYDPPELLWTITTDASILPGGTSLRSARIGHSQQSCLVAEVSLPNNRMVSFSLRTSSEPVNDYLYFEANGFRLFDRFTAEGNNPVRNWEPLNLFVLNGAGTLRWCYTKDGRNSAGDDTIAGDDSGWLDALSFSDIDSLVNIPLTRGLACQALDLSPSECSQITDLVSEPTITPWRVSTTATAGVISLQSGDINDGEKSCLTFDVSFLASPTVVQFFRRVDSQPADELHFSVGGQRLNYRLRPVADTTLRDWSREVHFVQSGNTSLSWCYTKDGSDPSGEDSAWIDELSFTPVADAPFSRELACLTLDMSGEDCAQIARVTFSPSASQWSVTAESSHAGGTSLRSPQNQNTCIIFDLDLPANTEIRASGRISLLVSSGGRDRLQFTADNGNLRINLNTISDPPNWRAERYFLPMPVSEPMPISELRWCYVRDFRDHNPTASGWIDRLSFSTSNISYKSRVCAALSLSDSDCSLVDSIRYEPPTSPWIITENTPVLGGSSMRSTDPRLRSVSNPSSCIILELAPELPAGAEIRASSRIDSSGSIDQLRFNAGNLRLDTISAAVSQTQKFFRQQSYFLSTATSTLRWCYFKSSSFVNASLGNTAWIAGLSFSTPDITYQDSVCTALGLSESDCSMIDSIGYEPPELLWTVTTDNPDTGDTSLRSARIGHSQQSCLVAEVSLPDNRMVSFSLRTSSEGVNDYLYFEANGFRLLDRFTAERNRQLRRWEPLNLFVLDGTGTFRWCYTKNGSISLGNDSGWLDTLSFSDIDSLVNIPLTRGLACQALDLSPSECSQITDLVSEPTITPWRVSTTATAGVISLQSGDINGGEKSCLTFDVSFASPTVVQFMRRVDSQPADELHFAAGGQRLNYRLRPVADTTLRDWSRELYFVQSGNTSLSWCYTKDGSDPSGEDSAWIDELSFTPVANARLDQELVCVVLDMSINDCARITAVSADPPGLPWVISPISTTGGSSLRGAAIEADESSCLVLSLVLPDNAGISVADRTRFEGNLDQLQFIADDNLRLDTISADADGASAVIVLREWRQQNYFLQNAITELRWCYAKNLDIDDDLGGAWIDNLSFSTSDITYQRRICDVLDLTEQNCRQIDSIRYDPPEFQWVITAETFALGGSSLRNANPLINFSLNRRTCIIFDLVPGGLPENTEIRASGRISSPRALDQLQFIADNNLRLDTIFDDADWRSVPESYFLPRAISELRWCYNKDDRIINASASAWIDRLSFNTSSISYQSRICAALDFEDSCSMIRSIRYNPPELLWIITSATSDFGGTSLRSANPVINRDQNQSTCIILELAQELPANTEILASARINASGGLDQLRFNAGNLRLDTISAPFNQTGRGWRQESYSLPTAISALSSCYNKSIPSGAPNTAWIDRLSVSTSSMISYQSSICDALDLTRRNCSLIQSIRYEPSALLWTITAETSIVPGGTSLRSARIGDSQQSCLALELSLPADSTISVAARTNSESGADQLLIHADNMLRDTISATSGRFLRDWQRETYPLPTAISELRWCYSKDSRNMRGDDSAWIDTLEIAVDEIALLCATLDLSDDHCAMIRSVTYEPPQSPWELSFTDSFRGPSAFSTPPINTGQETCVNIAFNSALPADNYVVFTWRITSQSEESTLRFQAGSQQQQIATTPQWQTEYIDLDGTETALRWCYTSEAQDSRAWLDSLLLVTPEDRYDVQIAVTATPTLISAQDTFQFSVEVSAVSPLLPLPTDWTLIVRGIDSIIVSNMESSPLVFVDGVAQFDILSTPNNPYLQSTVQITLRDRPSLLGATPASLDYPLPVRELAVLTIVAPDEVTQSTPYATIDIAVTVTATDNVGRPFESSAGLELRVRGIANADPSQSTYALTFAAGMAAVTVNAELTDPFSSGSIEVSVSSGDIQSTTSITLNPTPVRLAMLTIVAPDEVTQSDLGVMVAIPVTVTATDNYGRPFNPPARLELQVEGTGDTQLSQPAYALTFDAGRAAVTINAELVDPFDPFDLPVPGSIELSVSSGDIQSTASITLNPTPERLATLTIIAPNATLSTPGTTIEIKVAVLANSNYLRSFGPAGLVLRVTDLDNTHVSQSTYALTFTVGIATLTITVGLIDSDMAGSLEVSVSSGTIQATAGITINPPVRELTQLTIMAPTVVPQSTPYATFDIAVTVTATDNFDRPFEPAGLVLTVTNLDNTQVPLSTYALTFDAGMAAVTVNTDLADPFRSGSIALSVSSGTVQATASITLNHTPVRLAALSITAPAVLSQTVPGSAIDIAVTVTATDNYGRPINPAGLELAVTGLNNASVSMSQSTYALSFEAGMAQTTITVSLINPIVAGSIEISVSSGTIADSAAVSFAPPGRVLTQLSVVTDAVVTQSVPYTTINIVVTVAARDNFDLLFEPVGLTLRVVGTDGVRVLQSTYALTFDDGMVSITVNAELTDPFSSGSIEVSVSSGDIQSTASITLNPTPVRLAALLVIAPDEVTPDAPGATTEIAVTVTATDNYGRPFNPPAGLELEVTNMNNARVLQTTYALAFSNFMATATVNAALTAPFSPENSGSIEVSVVSGTIQAAASITLNPTPVRLAALLVIAPDEVTPDALGATTEIAVTVTATDNYGRPFNPPAGLELEVTNMNNARVLQTTYALAFSNFMATATVNAALTAPFSPENSGSIEVSVVSGTIQAAASITLNPTPVRLAALLVIAPDEVTPDALGATTEIAVTVTATDNYGRPFEPAGLVLQVEGTGAAQVSQTTYALTFISGMVDITVNAALTAPFSPESTGSIEVSVVSGTIQAAASITLNPTPVRLAALLVIAPDEVTPDALGATTEIAVTVTATDNYGRPFEPAGLVLQVEGTGAAQVSQTTYALTFISGMVDITVNAVLTAPFSPESTGSIEVSVSSGDIQAAASITLNPTPVRLAALLVIAPDEETPDALGATTEIAVTVTATDNYGRPFEPTGLVLQVEGTGAAQVSQTTYALTFISGMVDITVDAVLTAPFSPESTGSIEVSVVSGDIQAAASITLNPTPVRLAALLVIAPDEVTPDALGATTEIAVTVTATDNYGRPFEPTGLVLQVEGTGAAQVSQTTYALTFISGMVDITVDAALTAPFSPESTGSIEVSVVSGDIQAAASITLNPTPVRLAALLVIAPDEVTPDALGATTEIAVTVTATDNYGRPFEPAGLVLQVEGTGAAQVSQTTYALTFISGMVDITVNAALTAPFSPESTGSIEVSVVSGTIQATASITLNPTPVRLAALLVIAPDEVTQSTPDATIEIAVTVTATDNYGRPIDPAGLVLTVTDLGNARVSQSTYALTFTEGTAQTTITVGLTNRGVAGSIEVSVSSGEIQSTTSITLNPTPRVLVSVSLSAAASSLTQTMANTAVNTVLTLTALDNYGDPIAAGNINLQLSASNGAMIQTSLTVAIETNGTAQQIVEILPQNGIDTVVTIQLLQGTLDPAVLLLPTGGIQLEVRAVQLLNVENADPNVTELDLVVAMRWLADQQSSTASLVVNLTITSANITATGIDNLRQLFTGNSDLIDLNRDGRADQLDLRILVRYRSGLRGSALAGPEVSEEAIRLLLGRQP